MFLYSQWLSLPITTRIKIANDFGIIKKGSTHVVNNEIQSDGFSVKDIETALNTEAIQIYTGVLSNDLTILWAALVIKAQSDVHETNVVLDVPVIKIKKSYYKPKPKTDVQQKVKKTNSSKN